MIEANLTRVFTDFKSNVKMLVRNKGNLFWTLAFPVLFMLIFGSIFSISSNEPLTLYVQDNDSSFLSDLFNQTLNSTGAFEMRFVEPGIAGEVLNKTIEDKGIHRLLIIPAGFNASFAENGTANVTLLLDQADQQASAATYQIVRSVAYELSLAISGSGGGIGVPPNQYLPAQEEFRYVDFLLPGILGMTIMTSNVYGAIAINTRYRKNGILRKVATTPMTKAEWVISKVSYQIFVAFMSMSALLVVAVFVFDISVHVNAIVVLVVVTASMTFSGLGMIVARFVKDEEAAESAGGAINFPMMFLSGIFFPLEFMPAFLQVVGKAMPLYYVAEGLRDAMINVDMEGALLNGAVVFVLGVVIIAIGSVVSAWTDE